MTYDDRRLIEDYLPIQAISAEASREKSPRKGHISTLHLWWARRPLVACRAAVYGALVPASQFVPACADKAGRPNGGSDAQKKSLGRANAAKFIERLCQYPGSPDVIKEAQEHILKAHAERLSRETGKPVTVEDIVAGRAPLPAPRPGKFFIYVIKCSDDSFYIGQTDNVPRRFEEHNQGKVEWTSSRRPLQVIHYEEFDSREEAVTREKELKTGFGRQWLKREYAAGRLAARQAGRPKVLDMFAGGGAIPLEALRLGCESYALDLNPVAHIIQLCTLVYPQKFGKPDPNAKGSAKDGTWAGLAAEVEHWGNWVLKKVKAEIGDLYPPIPDPQASGEELGSDPQGTMGFAEDPQQKLKAKRGFLTPVAYLWTRTVQCKNPACNATVPLVKQTWLSKKKDHFVAMRLVAPKGEKRVRFEIVQGRSEAGLGFDPTAFSKEGNATCPFCGAVADSDYVQEQGIRKRVGSQLLAFVCRSANKSGSVFVGELDAPRGLLPTAANIEKRIEETTSRANISIPAEEISPLRPSPNARGMTAPTRHGLTTLGDLFNRRQLLSLLTQCGAVRCAHAEMRTTGYDEERSKAVATFLGIVVDRMADRGSSLCRWDPGYTKTQSTFGRPALPFVWDYSETNPFGDASGDMSQAIDWVRAVIDETAILHSYARVERGSAHQLSSADANFDAVISDPPYYDNVPYADISDFFYVWLKRSIGFLHPEHFGTELTPKKAEITALSSRFGGDMAAASSNYEQMMFLSLTEANRVLKANGELVIVYAHKTTLGWATLVDALRRSGFTVVEAWPLDTEFGGRLMAMDSAALASSIFLIARKRDGAKTGSYEDEIRPELEQIVRERVETLWRMGITGADLIIAAVGAGLRAFTRFARVEYANGEEVPAEKFLGEVESVVLETLLEKIFGVASSRVAAVDGPSRFYVLWRYAYRTAELDAGEAIVFTYGQPVELEGADGLANGTLSLVEKKKGKYRLRDYTERGPLEKLGLPNDEGKPAPLLDSLHRLLWLMENEPRKLPTFLDEARPDRERLRLVAQALAGAGLSGGSEDQTGVVNTTAAEQAALGKLLANWRALVPETLFTAAGKS
ncbi:MAG: DUF1156 domain-containing protein [Verrucomicrobia bacterium]|nr:DUF1156 domain-containing protein [Verrucomicrobiota bacterium]